MNIKALSFLFLFLLSTFVSGQVNEHGIPFIRNFDPLEYNASEQNWSMVQDNRGVMYFGNNDRGVLEFDGQNWRNIPVPNNSPVRSLAIDDSGTIFVGAIGEIGYLEPDATGLLDYKTLTHLIDSAYIDFFDVWKTHVINDTVYFASSSKLYIYDHKKISVREITGGQQNISPFMTFVIDEELYTGTFLKGIIKLEEDGYVPVENGDFFERINIFEILPFDDEHVLVCTGDKGVYKYNKHTGEVSDDVFSQNSQDYLKQHYLYHAIQLPGGYYAFATLYGGALIIDPRGDISQLITAENGLRDQVVSAVYNNHENNMQRPLWLTMNNGIAYVESHNPLRSFGEESGLRGLVVDVIRYNGILYVATMSGVFYLEFTEANIPVFRQLDEIRNAAWSLVVSEIPGKGERLIAGTQGGIFEIDSNNRVESITAQLEDKTHNCFSILPSEHHPERIYLGLANEIEYIEYNDTRWEDIIIEGINDEIRNIKEDDEGNLWLATYINGLIRVEFTENDTISTYYNHDNGLPEVLKNIQIQEYEGKLIFSTIEGIFLFDETNETFYPDNRFEDVSGRPDSGVSQLIKDDEGVVWISAYDAQDRWIATLYEKDDGSFDADDTPFKPFPPIWCDVIYPDNDNVVWFGISNVLYSFNSNISRNYQQPFNALIRRVTISQIDSVLFNGTNYTVSDNDRLLTTLSQPDELKPRLRFSNNRLEFEFASPFFDSHDKTEFSWFLEGEDRMWTNWNSETRAQYTYLREGYYTFRVRARNVYGTESREAVYEFYISPPWHRTIAAYIGYLILLSLFIYAIVVFNSRRLKKEKIILEGIVRERTAEIMKQKEEIEAQRDKIADQNKNITDSIEYARRIQTAILPPGDYVKELLPQRFILFLPRDIVSGDFYWLTKLNRRIISVAADCTGHGVPGGFMSMLGIAFLNEIVNKSPDDVTAGKILDQLREQVIASLHQTGKSGETQDGMDVSLFILDWENKSIEFAGANNPLIIIRNKKIIEIKGDKMPIGIHDRADMPFTNHIVDLKDGDVIYTFSDGYQDQFGGPKGKKFMVKRLKNMLLDICGKPMQEQRDILLKELEEWQGSFERVDDIIVMGVRI